VLTRGCKSLRSQERKKEGKKRREEKHAKKERLTRPAFGTDANHGGKGKGQTGNHRSGGTKKVKKIKWIISPQRQNYEGGEKFPHLHLG